MPIAYKAELVTALSNYGIQVVRERNTMDLYVPTQMIYVHAEFMHNALYIWGEEDGVEKVLHFLGKTEEQAYYDFLQAVHWLVEDTRRPAYQNHGE